VESARAGMAAGLVNTMRQVGTVGGVAVIAPSTPPTSPPPPCTPSTAGGRATSQASAKRPSRKERGCAPWVVGPLVFFRLAGITSLPGCSAR
jgi:hypothetical protein